MARSTILVYVVTISASHASVVQHGAMCVFSVFEFFIVKSEKPVAKKRNNVLRPCYKRRWRTHRGYVGLVYLGSTRDAAGVPSPCVTVMKMA